MKTTAEMKIEVSNVRKSNIDDCILVEASKLSLKDVFMSHKPKTEAEKKFKATLTKVIESGIEDFYKPIFDPSFADKKNTKIHFVAGEKPAVGKSYDWWKETIKDSKWCFGTKSQYVAFLGVLIKIMVAKGWTVDEAWDSVCNDSKKLGHYLDSDNTKHQLEDTGSREFLGFFDLGNLKKMVAADEETDSFWLAGGYYMFRSRNYPLAYLWQCKYCYCDQFYGIAWLVLKQ